jgi:hypothetical protein
MYKRLDRAHRAMSLVLGVLTLVSLGMLLAWNLYPKFFPIRAHGSLAAFPLAMIAIAYLLYQSARRPSAKEFLKAMMLAAAFLFWAANQLWPDLPQAAGARVPKSTELGHLLTNYWSSSALESRRARCASTCEGSRAADLAVISAGAPFCAITQLPSSPAISVWR